MTGVPKYKVLAGLSLAGDRINQAMRCVREGSTFDDRTHARRPLTEDERDHNIRHAVLWARAAASCAESARMLLERYAEERGVQVDGD